MLRSATTRLLRRSSQRARADDTIWAVRDVTFDVQAGEAVGIIGPNGAGKSTLLKLLSRITDPTEGRAEVGGRISSLLEVGTGFHPELTGRENLYLSGAILGMKRAEIAASFDEIVAFAGVERFVETQVKHYSSGMYMRLAFSIAAHLRTEVLLIDEALAVGDASFQLKSLQKMTEVATSGKTVLFVSHNVDAVSKLCSRCVLLDGGRIQRIGTAEDCIEQYLTAQRAHALKDGVILQLHHHPGRTKDLNGPVRLASLALVDHSGRATWSLTCGGGFDVKLGYELVDGATPQNAMFVVTFSNAQNQRIASCRSNDTHAASIRISKSGEVTCRIKRLPLVPGFYRLTVGCNTEAGWSDGVYDAALVEVTGAGFYSSGQVPPRSQGDVLFDHEWHADVVS